MTTLPMIRYFTPDKELSALERQKTSAFIVSSLILLLLLFVLLIHSLFFQATFSASDYFIPISQLFVIFILFYVKKKGVRAAGNVFSLGILLILTLIINILDQDTIITKYAEEFYLSIIVLVYISLFGSRKLLILATVVIFVSSLRIYSILKPDTLAGAGKLLDAQVYFSFAIFNAAIILYFITRFSDRAIETATQDAQIKDKQNKALEKAIRRAEESELLYKNIFYNLVGGFYKYDADGKIVLVSPSTKKLLGFTDDSILGKPTSDFFIHQQEADKFFRRIKDNGKVEVFKAEIRSKTLGNIYVETNARAIVDDSGKFQGVEGIFYDITEQRKMELELAEHRNNLELLVKQKTLELEASNTQLKSINDELNKQGKLIKQQNADLHLALQHLKEAQSKLVQAEKMASLGVLTAGVAHEINNPLNFIMGASQALEIYYNSNTNEHDESVQGLLDAIKEGVTRTTTIVKGLNQFSRDNISIDEACDIPAIMENCMTMLRSDVKTRNLEKDYDAGLMMVKGNVGKLHQVFLNLLQNAVQATEIDGHLTIHISQHKTKQVILIKDDGHGISSKNLKKVMDPFFTTKKPGEGTGLGLSITYKIIEDHQGSMEIFSEHNEGTTIKITLPCLPAEAA